MKKIIISAIYSIAFVCIAMPQTASDALMLSQNYAGGTARSVGMSGAVGAVGGDLSTLRTNPAGIAVFRGSEFTFTPTLNFVNTKALFDDVTYKESGTRIVINNIGYVYTKNFYNQTGIQSVNFGIAYNRLSDFNSDAYIRASPVSGSGSSMLDEFVYIANGSGSGHPLAPENLDPFYEGLAYDTYGIDIYGDEVDAAGFYYNDYITDGRRYDQPMKRTMLTRGGIGEYDLSIGANLNHKLYFGATLGIQDVHFEDYYYHEEVSDFEYMQSFDFYQQYITNGWGLNFKAGLIYRPVQMLRLGLSIHTPTHFWLSPYLLTGMETRFNNSPSGDGETYFSLESESDPSERYKASTPWRYHASAAVMFGNFGLVDIDMEYINYSACNILPNADYKSANDDISAFYKSAVNMKGGAEFRLGLVYLRGGLAYYGSPYKKDMLSDGDESYKATMSYSGGVGFRLRSFYMDVAYSYTKYPQRLLTLYQTFDNPNDSPVNINTNMQTIANRVLLTFGFRF